MLTLLFFLLRKIKIRDCKKKFVRSELRLDNKYPAAKVNPVYEKWFGFLDKKVANLFID